MKKEKMLISIILSGALMIMAACNAADKNSQDTAVNGTCSGCLISGICYPEGLRNPENPCESCKPGISAEAWSSNDGASCDDGIFCNGTDSCEAGACTVHGGVNCSDGVDCNGLETCDAGLDRCVAGTSTCAAGEFCDTLTNSCNSNGSILVNNDFEYGGYGWLTTGAAGFLFMDANMGCTQGDSCAFLTSCSYDEGVVANNCGPVASSSVPAEEVESFCGMEPGDLAGAIEGSAITTGTDQNIVTNNTNTRIVFSYNVLTNEGSNPDYVFVHYALSPPGNSRETVTALDVVLQSYLFFPHTGPLFANEASWIDYHICIPDPTPHIRLCVGVMDAVDRVNSTAVLIDNVRFLGGGGGGCPGFTYAHDDILNMDVQVGATVNIPYTTLLSNDSDTGLPITSVGNAVCGVSGTPGVSLGTGNVVFEAGSGINAGDECRFDYEVTGPRSPYDPTVTISRATVSGITIIP